jgi:hypothetical protein
VKNQRKFMEWAAKELDIKDMNGHSGVNAYGTQFYRERLDVEWKKQQIQGWIHTIPSLNSIVRVASENGRIGKTLGLQTWNTVGTVCLRSSEWFCMRVVNV